MESLEEENKTTDEIQEPFPSSPNQEPGTRLPPRGYPIRNRHTGEIIVSATVTAGKDGVRRPSLRRTRLVQFKPLSFRSADLRGVDFSEANLAQCDLSDANLKGVILSGVTYDRFTRWPEGFDPVDKGAIMVPPVLSGANLEDYDLSGEDLSGADLRGANLAGAKLIQTNLSRAQLNGAKVAGTNFTGADLTDAVLTGVRADATTRWPEGFDLQKPVRVKDTPPTLDTLVTLLKTLADPARLKILGFVSGEEATVEEIADALELAEATVSHHLTRLKEQGLVTVRPEGTRRLHQTDSARLNKLLQSIPGEAIRLARGGVDPTILERKVLETFFEGERLKEMPARSMKKQKIVLKRIVEAFEHGVRYPEKQVNEILKRFHPDFATLRRYLVDYRFMARENNIYWRV